jgi:tripartite-type tricarboxylate transporter receptor subunit TctC
MKKWRTAKPVLIGLALATVVAACGSSDDAPAAPAAPAPAAPAAPAAPEAFDAETYFDGKTIRFITSSRAGGGTDLQIRTLASQITKYIPGNPAVQVSNVTPHVAGINFLWNSEPDGLTIALFSAPTLEFEYFEGATWDSSQFEYVGAVDNLCQSMMLMRGNLGYSSIEDLKGATGQSLVTLAAAATAADVEPFVVSTMLIAEYLDIPLEVKRVAEEGTSALFLALERGEINMVRMGTSWCRIPEFQPGWLENSFLIPFLDVSLTGKADYMPPIVEELGLRPLHVSEVVTPEQYQEWLGIVAATRAGGTPLTLPPNTPAEIVQAWRDIWDTAFADEDFFEAITVGWGGAELIVADGATAAETFSTNKALMDANRERATEVIERLFAKYVN